MKNDRRPVRTKVEQLRDLVSRMSLDELAEANAFLQRALDASKHALEVRSTKASILGGEPA